MTHIARKVDKLPRWQAARGNGVEPDEISADALTTDLKTEGSALSFWSCGVVTASGGPSQIDDVVLALCANAQRLDAVTIVWVEVASLEQQSIKIVRSPGVTPVSDLTDKHVDVVRLDVQRVGVLAEALVNSVANQCFRRFDTTEIKSILTAAITARRLNPGSLAPSIKTALGPL